MPRSRSSSGGSPPAIALEVRPSPRLLWGALAALGTILAALAAAPRPAAGWRLAAAVLTVALAWRPAWQSVAVRGPRAVRHICWTVEGRWDLRVGERRVQGARLLPASAAVGPWLVLRWALPGGAHACAILDAAALEPRTFRALRGRLRVHGARGLHRAVDDSC